MIVKAGRIGVVPILFAPITGNRDQVRVVQWRVIAKCPRDAVAV